MEYKKEKCFNDYIIATEMEKLIDYNIENKINLMPNNRYYRGTIQSINGDTANILLAGASTEITDVKINPGLNLFQDEDVFVLSINGNMNNLIITNKVLSIDLLYNITVDNYTNIETFQDYTDWSIEAGDGILSDDNIYHKYNGNGLRSTFANYSETYIYNKSNAIDLTQFSDGSASTTDDYIGISFYVSDINGIDTSTGVLIYFYTVEFSDYYIYGFDSPTFDIATGWNYFKVKKSAFSSMGSPDWSNIQSYDLEFDVITGYEDEFLTFGLVTMIKELDTGGGGGSLPQPLDTTDSPTFAGLTVSGLTADRAIYANGSKQLTSSLVTSTSLNYISGLDQYLSTSTIPTFRELNLIRTSNDILLYLNHNASSGNSANYTEIRMDAYVNAANVADKITFYNRGNQMASIECWTTSFYTTPELRFYTDSLAMTIDDYQNILINDATRPTNAYGALSLKKGTEPTATTSDQIDIFASTDTSTTLGINTEQSVVSEGFSQDTTWTIRINGALYKVPLESIP